MARVFSKLVTFASDESGATAVEYAVIGAFLTTAIMLGMPAIKSALNLIFSSVSTSMTTYAAN